MALQVWLPLNKGNINNYGVSDLKFSVVSSNTADNVSGKLGRCYSNDSNSGGGLISDKPINLGQKISMFCWVNMTQFTASASLTGILGQHRYQTCQGTGITMHYTSNTTGQLSINTGNGNGSRTYSTYYGNTTLTAGNWYHVGFTYDNGTWKLYVNGNLDGTFSPYTNSNVNDYIGIFCWSLGGTSGARLHEDYKLRGALNDVRIYDNVLSQKEIKELAKGLVLHYKLDNPYMEGTTNLGMTSINYSTQTYGSPYTLSGWGGDAGTVTYYNSGGYNDGPYKVYHKTATGSGGVYRKIANDIVIEAGKTYTFSCYVKASRDYTDSNYSFNINRGSDNYYITVNNAVHFTTNWTRISRTFTASSSDAGNYGEMSIIYDDSETDYYVYWSCFLIEEKDHATPFTRSTRPSEVIDASGYGNDGIIVGSVQIADSNARFSKCCKFDGAKTGYIQFPYQSLEAPYALKSLTFAFWIKAPQKGSRHMILGETNSYATNIELLTDNQLRMYWDNTPDWSNILSCPENEWTHIVIYVGSDEIRVYLNGELYDKYEGSPSWGGITGDFLIGSDQRIGTYFLGSYLSDFRVYATELSADDVLNLYHTSASVDNHQNLHCFELEEETIPVSKVKKTGVVETGEFEEAEIIAYLRRYDPWEYYDNDNLMLDPLDYYKYCGEKIIYNGQLCYIWHRIDEGIDHYTNTSENSDEERGFLSSSLNLTLPFNSDKPEFVAVLYWGDTNYINPPLREDERYRSFTTYGENYDIPAGTLLPEEYQGMCVLNFILTSGILLKKYNPIIYNSTGNLVIDNLDYYQYFGETTIYNGLMCYIWHRIDNNHDYYIENDDENEGATERGFLSSSLNLTLPFNSDKPEFVAVLYWGDNNCNYLREDERLHSHSKINGLKSGLCLPTNYQGMCNITNVNSIDLDTKIYKKGIITTNELNEI